MNKLVRDALIWVAAVIICFLLLWAASLGLEG